MSQGGILKKRVSTNNPDEPALSEHTVAFLSVCRTPRNNKNTMNTKRKKTTIHNLVSNSHQVLLTLLYVLPFYLSSTTRPSPNLSRDAPSVIRARIRAVTGSCIVSSVLVLWLIIEDNSSLGAGVRLLGWWPVGLLETLRSLFLTAVLFLGPLFERGIVEGEWKFWFRRSKLSESLGGWIGWRNYVAVCNCFSFSIFSSLPYFNNISI